MFSCLYCNLQYNTQQGVLMMSTTTTRSSRSKRKSTGGSLMVRLDGESKRYLARAAELRRVSMSDYIRLVTISQARREVQEAEHNTIRLMSNWHSGRPCRRPSN
jgi:predicted HicB family RNase H-like nuclease